MACRHSGPFCVYLSLSHIHTLHPVSFVVNWWGVWDICPSQKNPSPCGTCRFCRVSQDADDVIKFSSHRVKVVAQNCAVIRRRKKKLKLHSRSKVSERQVRFFCFCRTLNTFGVEFTRWTRSDLSLCLFQLLLEVKCCLTGLRSAEWV